MLVTHRSSAVLVRQDPLRTSVSTAVRSDPNYIFLNRGSYDPLFFMSGTDLKYLIASYQQKSMNLFTQSVATDAKIRQLTDTITQLSELVNTQQEEIEKLSKTKTTRKTQPARDGGFLINNTTLI